VQASAQRAGTAPENDEWQTSLIERKTPALPGTWLLGEELATARGRARPLTTALVETILEMLY
jgi:hypothetical protein